MVFRTGQVYVHVNTHFDHVSEEARVQASVIVSSFIEEHFAEIKAHACDIESRLDDSYCTAQLLIADNEAVACGFTEAGEEVTLIDKDYETALEGIICK